MNNAIIVTIGDELLNGYRLDTNSQWLSTELSNINFNILTSISIGDDVNIIIKTLEQLSELNTNYIYLPNNFQQML